MKRCGVTKTISPPSIKLEPQEPEPQSMLPDSSSDLRQRQKNGHFHHRIKTEFEVKQEPSWDGEVSQTRMRHSSLIPAQLKMEGSTAPSSSSNHVVLERLNGGKGDKKLEAGDLPALGEDDIHNVIGSCNSSFHSGTLRED